MTIITQEHKTRLTPNKDIYKKRFAREIPCQFNLQALESALFSLHSQHNIIHQRDPYILVFIPLPFLQL